ncbi:MAG: HEAT repeat domain-containing protein, partial [Steroidobacteraceae bacterium]
MVAEPFRHVAQPFGMWRRMRTVSSILLIVLVSHASAQAPSVRDRMLAAEDARVRTAAGMAPLLQGLRAVDPKLVVQAVRGLGRFERPELIDHIIALATHARPDVRGAALNA